MSEQPTSPKSSETDPPAANQPIGDDEATEPSQSNQPPASELPVQPDPRVAPGKPDGEVDTRPERGNSLG